MPKRRKGMPERWATFCAHYLTNGFNATDAAKEAGFSEKYAANMGSRLLQRESIKVHISNEIEKALGAEKATLKKRILDELEAEAFSNGVFEDTTAQGGTITRANPNKMKALEMLAKYLSLLVDRVELTGKDGEPLKVTYEPLPETAKE